MPKSTVLPPRCWRPSASTAASGARIGRSLEFATRSTTATCSPSSRVGCPIRRTGCACSGATPSGCLVSAEPRRQHYGDGAERPAHSGIGFACVDHHAPVSPELEQTDQQGPQQPLSLVGGKVVAVAAKAVDKLLLPADPPFGRGDME